MSAQHAQELALLESIDAKLGALLALLLDQQLRASETTRSKPRSMDRLLADAGLSNQQIAALLGKTDRAVRMRLAFEKNKKKKDG